MPVYEYKCEICGSIKEIICKFSEREDEIICDNCLKFKNISSKMKLIPSTTSFKVNGYNEKNGYSRSKDIGNRK